MPFVQHLPVHVVIFCPFDINKQTRNAPLCLFVLPKVTPEVTLTYGFLQALKGNISAIQIIHFSAGRGFMDSRSIGNIHHPMHCSSLLCCTHVTPTAYLLVLERRILPFSPQNISSLSFSFERFLQPSLRGFVWDKLHQRFWDTSNTGSSNPTANKQTKKVPEYLC